MSSLLLGGRGQRGNAAGRARGRGRGRGGSSTPHGATAHATSNTNGTAASNPFDQERLENAAKRENRTTNALRGSLKTRGSAGRGGASKQVRFNTPDASSQPAAASKANPFAAAVASPLSTMSSSSINTASPFAQTPSSLNPFRNATTKQTSGGFGSASGNGSIASPFGSPALLGINGAKTNPFGQPAAQSGSGDTNTSNPFSAPMNGQNGGAFGKPSDLASSTSPFNQLISVNGSATTRSTTTANPFQSNAIPFGIANANGPTITAGFQPPANAFGQSAIQGLPTPTATNEFAAKIAAVLKQNGISPPPWPATPGDPRQKDAVEKFWHEYKGYRAKARACLIKNSLLDDPDKPKKLSEAIDFKGTCEDMCPEFEKVTRIVEHDVQGAEKETDATGSMIPCPPKMIKALARSAAGQDAPLPSDVRSPAALRRTLDYLINTIIGQNDLASVHGFLWNRTRAIRRDFTFQESSMNPEELGDQVYCLERIARFHVVALHQMSGLEVPAEDFSEQQELEQLGKTLLSLIHAYEDCKMHNVTCENEAEFRAYYVMFNSQNSGILETVQGWGWKFWSESEDIRTAVSLVECLQNTWDAVGPLRPYSGSDIAQNAYSRFFSIVKDPHVSYIMACFAEIHFNRVRKAVLMSILAAYQMQKGQTRDWTVDNLNIYLQFDEPQDLIDFVEAYKLGFETIEGDECLSFRTAEQMEDPFPVMRQPHCSMVESKRGYYSIPEAIHQTVFDDNYSAGEGMADADDSDAVTFTPSPAFGAPSSFTGVSNNMEEMAGSTENDDSQSLFVPDDSHVESLEANPPSSVGLDLAPAEEADEELFPPKRSILSTGSLLQPGTVSTAETSSLSPLTNSQPSKLSPFSGLFKPQGSSQADSATQGTSPLAAPAPAAAPSIFTSKPLDSGSKPFFSFGTDLASTQASHVENEAPITLTSEKSASKDSDPSTESPPVFPDPPVQQANVLPSSPPESPPPSIADTSATPAPKPAEPDIEPGPTQAELVQGFAQWFAMGREGIVDQFMSYKLESIVTEAIDEFAAEQERLRLEQDRQDRAQADNFRWQSLATKYFYKWRENAQHMWMRRRGREARELRRKLAETDREAKRRRSADIISEFNAAQKRTSRKSMEDMLLQSQVLDGVHSSHTEAREISRPLTGSAPSTPTGSRVRSLSNPRPAPRESTRQSSSLRASAIENRLKHTSQDRSVIGHLRSQSADRLRRSLIGNPSHLNASIRAQESKSRSGQRRQPSGVMTDYFRLKARGITTLPDGTPLATAAAIYLPLEGSPDLSSSSASQPTSSLALSHSEQVAIYSNSDVVDGRDIQSLKARARILLGQDKSTQKRGYDEDEEELFAKAKRIREQMDEGVGWYKSEMAKFSSSP